MPPSSGGCQALRRNESIWAHTSTLVTRREKASKARVGPLGVRDVRGQDLGQGGKRHCHRTPGGLILPQTAVMTGHVPTCSFCFLAFQVLVFFRQARRAKLCLLMQRKVTAGEAKGERPQRDKARQRAFLRQLGTYCTIFPANES